MKSSKRKKKALVPSLRFAEFEGDWDEEEFEQVFKPIASKRFQIQNSQIQNRGTYEVIDQGKDDIAGYSDEFEKLFKNVPVIVFGDHTTILKLIKTPFIVGADGTKLLTNRRHKDNLEYLYYLLISENIKQDGYKRHFSVLKKIVPGLASPAEQQKIADCFSSLDDLIAAETEQLTALQDHKKGLMQQLFHAEGKTTPNHRFPEFKGEWDEEEFEQVFKPIASKRFQIQNSQIQNRGTYEVIDQGKDDIAGYSDEFEKLFKNVPVIVFGDHTTILKLIKTPFIVGADGTKLLTNRRHKDNLEYLYYLLISKNIKQDGYKRHFSVLKKIVPCLASPAEQQKIADCLSSLDQLIVAQSEKIETLKEHKKGLLQQLFPSAELT